MKKLVIKKANSDVRYATTQWQKYGNVEIDDILKRMGYIAKGSYSFKKKVYTGTEAFMIHLDTYPLVIGREGIKMEVVEC